LDFDHLTNSHEIMYDSFLIWSHFNLLDIFSTICNNYVADTRSSEVEATLASLYIYI
jgi:hypothetical protein